jgi:hypothetical protein
LSFHKPVPETTRARAAACLAWAYCTPETQQNLPEYQIETPTSAALVAKFDLRASAELPGWMFWPIR